MRPVIAALILFLPALLRAGPVEFSDAWSRATPPGAPTGAVYGTLINQSDDIVTIAGVETDVARQAEIHTTTVEDGMMKMREDHHLALAPGEHMVLEPGGRHVMLMGLNHALSEGDVFELTIRFGERDAVTTSVRVGGFGQMEPPR